MTFAEFMKSTEAEIDALYVHFADRMNSYLLEIGPPIKLTFRQRIRAWTWRLRSALAAPFAWVVKLLDPSRLAQDD